MFVGAREENRPVDSSQHSYRGRRVGSLGDAAVVQAAIGLHALRHLDQYCARVDSRDAMVDHCLRRGVAIELSRPRRPFRFRSMPRSMTHKSSACRWP